MTAAVSTLVELGELHRTRPGVDAPPAVTAAWLEHQSLVLHHLAAESRDDERYEAMAHRAYTHALELLLGGGR